MNKMNKTIIDNAIEAIKTAARISEDFYGKHLIITYSGGKDSDVLLDLALKSGIRFEVCHSVTTVDAPQTNRHVNKVFKKMRDIGIKCTKVLPKYKGEPTNMYKLIVDKGIPPTRMVRYCCRVFKEMSTPDRVVAIGVRAAESAKRRGRDVFSTGGRNKNDFKYFDLNHVKEVFKNAMEQDPVWDCTIVENARKNKELMVYPIYHWTDMDVWGYIRDNSINYNPLYDMGYSRVGCVFCPLARRTERQRDEVFFPEFKARYINAFENMLKKRKASGKDDSLGKWKDGEAVFRWFVEDYTNPDQIGIEEYLNGKE